MEHSVTMVYNALPTNNWITVRIENSATPVRVIYNDPYTIVYFRDGDKIVVKAEGDTFNKEFGLSVAIARKVVGSRNGIKRLINSAKVQEEKI